MAGLSRRQVLVACVGSCFALLATVSTRAVADSPPGQPAPSTAPPPVAIATIDNGALRDELLNRFPSTFGGLVRNGDGSLSILETAPDSALQATARSAVAHRPSQARPALSYQIVAMSLAGLRALKDKISADRKLLLTEGIDVQGIGIRDGDNSLVVSLGSDTPANRQVLYGRTEGITFAGSSVHSSHRMIVIMMRRHGMAAT